MFISLVKSFEISLQIISSYKRSIHMQSNLDEPIQPLPKEQICGCIFLKVNISMIFRAEGLFTKTATHHFMNGSVEAVILCKDQQNDKGHVNMV